MDTFLSKDTKAQVHKDVRPIASDVREFDVVSTGSGLVGATSAGPRIADEGEDTLGRPYDTTDPIDPGDDGYKVSDVVYGPALKSEVFSPVEKVGWTDEARAAAAAARAAHGGRSAADRQALAEPWAGMEHGTAPSIDHAVYSHAESRPKYNGRVNPLAADYHEGGKMLRERLPHMNKANHIAAGDDHARESTHNDRLHAALVNTKLEELKQHGVDPGPLVSGIVSDKFDEGTKTSLRQFATNAGRHGNAAMAHYAAGRLTPDTARFRLHGGHR